MKHLLSVLWLHFICVHFVNAQQLNVDHTVDDQQAITLDFSVEGGFYSKEVEVELFSNGSRIYYTLDGTMPNSRAGRRYKKPIKINQTTPLRAVAYRGKEKSKVTGHTYLIKEPKTGFAVISIQISPDILFDPEKGLYMEGTKVIDSTWSKPGANFWSKREKKINAEIFEPNGKCIYRSPSGFRLFGGMSRLFPQKSMTLVARDDYGKKRIRNKIYGEEGLKKFKFLVLRNSGSDFPKAHFRDAFMTTLLDDWDIEKQDTRPSHVYINGVYWGIYNIREKINRYFLEDHCDIDKDSVDIMEHQRVRKRGSRKHYFEMLDVMETKDLAEPSVYAYVNSLMDIQNFMDYQIAQIYFDNQDAGGNIKYWRPRTENGRWRWVIYDTDWGFGLHDEKAYKNNSILFHTKPNGPHWPNPPWSTFILRNLMKNQLFKDQFVVRFCDYINTTFEPTSVLETLNGFYKEYDKEIDRHHERWNLERSDWLEEIEIMRRFAAKRPNYMRRHLQKTFDAGEEVEVEIATETGGIVQLNHNVTIKNKAFEGIYFDKLPIHIKAIPHLGYRFSHWEGISIKEESFTLSLDKATYKLKAVFEPYVHPLAGKVIINEINSNYKKAGDWVEIFNNSKESIQMEDWLMVDDNNNEFKFPRITLQSNNYLVVCENKAKFQKVYPNQYKMVGDLSFGLNKRKEKIQLFTNKGEIVDSIGYQIEPIDSAMTLNLLLPELENGDFENWEIINGYGTPNAANPYYLESRVRGQQAMWVKVGSMFGVFLVFVFLIAYKKGFS